MELLASIYYLHKQQFDYISSTFKEYEQEITIKARWNTISFGPKLRSRCCLVEFLFPMNHYWSLTPLQTKALQAVEESLSHTTTFNNARFRCFWTIRSAAQICKRPWSEAPPVFWFPVSLATYTQKDQLKDVIRISFQILKAPFETCNVSVFALSHLYQTADNNLL